MAIDLLPSERDPARFNQSIRELNQGRGNITLTGTLTPSVASTTFNFVNCSKAGTVFWTPLTANASAEIGNGSIRLSAINNGSFVITHANNAQADRTFIFTCLGG